MKFKMIACDYDGTICPPSTKKVPLYTKEAIHKYIRKGGIFAICTGRIFSSILLEAKKLELSGALICLQGSAIYSLDTEELLYAQCLTQEDTISALEFAESQNRICHMYYKKDYYVERPNEFTEFYSKYCNIEPVYTNCKLSEFAKQNNVEAFKIIILTPPFESDEVLSQAQEFLKDSVEVSKSGPIFIEIVSAKSGKGNAVKVLAERYGIPLEEVAVFGDALNDLSMLKIAGLAVVVEDAMDSVKPFADIITESAENCGATKIIEKIIANEI